MYLCVKIYIYTLYIYIHIIHTYYTHIIYIYVYTIFNFMNIVRRRCQGWREHQIDSAGRQIIHWSPSGGNRVERRSTELSTCRGNRSYNWLGLQLRHQLFMLYRYDSAYRYVYIYTCIYIYIYYIYIIYMYIYTIYVYIHIYTYVYMYI